MESLTYMNMEPGFQLFPEQASTVAPQVDALYIFLLAVSGFFTTLIFLAIVYLAYRYRHGRPQDQPRPEAEQFWLLEAAWIAVPFALTMVMFFWGAKLYFDIRTPPNGAMELQVVGKQWMWKIYHPQGRREINELHIPVGTPVRLRMISEDVIHSFFIPAFRVKMDVLPEHYTTMWFEATKPGEYHLFCAEYCGTDHADMSGRVVAMEPDDFAEWLEDTTTETPQTAGAQLFSQFRCYTCHDDNAELRSPPLHGIFNNTVALADGRTVHADDSYLRESIVNPMAKVTAGFQPLMPTYRGQLTEEQLFQLVEYIKSLPPRDAKNDAS
jgi:cytochrome c oxidase subunit 2